jgi:hypothetical protein
MPSDAADAASTAWHRLIVGCWGDDIAKSFVPHQLPIIEKYLEGQLQCKPDLRALQQGRQFARCRMPMIP